MRSLGFFREGFLILFQVFRGCLFVSSLFFTKPWWSIPEGWFFMSPSDRLIPPVLLEGHQQLNLWFDFGSLFQHLPQKKGHDRSRMAFGVFVEVFFLLWINLWVCEQGLVSLWARKGTTLHNNLLFFMFQPMVGWWVCVGGLLSEVSSMKGSCTIRYEKFKLKDSTWTTLTNYNGNLQPSCLGIADNAYS